MDARVVNTADLKVLNSKAVLGGMNRALSDAAVAALDPDGLHVLDLVLYGHNMDSTVLHHRTRVLFKLVGSDAPAEAFLDVLDEDWKRLRTAASVLA